MTWSLEYIMECAWLQCKSLGCYCDALTIVWPDNGHVNLSAVILKFMPGWWWWLWQDDAAEVGLLVAERRMTLFINNFGSGMLGIFLFHFYDVWLLRELLPEVFKGFTGIIMLFMIGHKKGCCLWLWCRRRPWVVPYCWVSCIWIRSHVSCSYSMAPYPTYEPPSLVKSFEYLIL